jgi:hypothetical protein
VALELVGYVTVLLFTLEPIQMNVAAATEKFTVPFFRSISLIYLTYLYTFFRKFIQISYILMVQDRQKFKNEGFHLIDKINVCYEIAIGYA